MYKACFSKRNHFSIGLMMVLLKCLSNQTPKENGEHLIIINLLKVRHLWKKHFDIRVNDYVISYIAYKLYIIDYNIGFIYKLQINHTKFANNICGKFPVKTDSFSLHFLFWFISCSEVFFCQKTPTDFTNDYTYQRKLWYEWYWWSFILVVTDGFRVNLNSSNTLWR